MSVNTELLSTALLRVIKTHEEETVTGIARGRTPDGDFDKDWRKPSLYSGGIELWTRTPSCYLELEGTAAYSRKLARSSASTQQCAEL